MKNLLLALSFFVGVAQAAPTLKITTPLPELAVAQTAVVTFKFSEPVTGFDLTDAHIQGDAQWVGGLNGSGDTYTATILKLLTKNSISVLVDNKSYAAAIGGALGSYASLGINASPTIYIYDGNIINPKLIVAVPQPRCPLAGEYLADAAGNPSARVYEDFYVFRGSREALFPERLPFTCLNRLINGQQYKAKVAPSNHEMLNPNGGHNHGTEMPKATTQTIQPLVGTTRVRVTPSNAETCGLNGAGVLQCGSKLYDNVQLHGFGGGDTRWSTIASKFLNDDPIVYSGVRGAAHLHTFFGNNGINYQTNNANLQTTCVSLFAGGAANCTGYWMPSVIDTATDTPLLPDSILIYYKADTFYIDERYVEELPQGLKIIAGNPSAKSQAEQIDIVKFECFRKDNVQEAKTNNFISCDSDKYREVWLTVTFPHCVQDDGTGKIKLDSANHRSHLIPNGFISANALLPNSCPTEYPHLIPNISQIAMFTIKPGMNPATWRLSSDNYSSSLPGGYSLHADWWGAWKNYWSLRLRNECNRKPFGCGTNYIGRHDGVKISSITTEGNKAIITAENPHKLQVSNPDGTYPYIPQPSTDQRLLGLVSGVTGVDAAAYNYDPNKISAKMQVDGRSEVAPHGVQPFKILNATQIEYTLNYTPTNTTVNVSNAIAQWGESFCTLEDTRCNTEYSEYYYKDKQ